MRQGMECLLAVLRGQTGDLCFDDSAWSSLLRVAGEENVLPLVADRLHNSPINFTSEQSARIAEIQRKAQFSSFIWVETLKTVLSAFHRGEITVVPLKGPVLAKRLYDDVALRAYADLDLLVRSYDLLTAEHALADLGFKATGRGDDYHRSWVRNSIHLELHHNIDHPLAFDFDVNKAWHRVQCSEYAGIPIKLLSPADELTYLCVHAVRHRFDRLCLLVDLGLAFRMFPLRQASAPPSPAIGNILTLAWLMASRLDPDIPALADGLTTAAERVRLTKLADGVWQELMDGPAELLDWKSQHRFFLEVESPGRSRLVRRWRHLCILGSRLIDLDYEFAARFHLYRPWQARLLRPVRIVRDTFRRR
jgi:hypothetical protein